MTNKKGKVIKFNIEKRLLPNGRRINLEIIRHPGAVLIAPFLDKNHIIMIRQFRPVIDTYLYELPAGTIDLNEKPLACAKREIVEEIGYSASKITCLGKIYPVPGYSTEVIWIYKGEKLKIAQIANEPDEIIKVCILNKAQVKRLFKQRRITDAKTICALAFCGWA